MSRWFNIADPCQEDIRYMLPPTTRLPDLEELIQQRSYFVVHAPRQTGKTTAMLALAQQLTASERYTAVMVSASATRKNKESSSWNLQKARLGLNEGWLLVFDRRKNALPIESRLSTKVVTTENQRSITVIRA